ncbi:hypothetical protein LCGC14_1147730 [marine sediment metagenome]|uniref:Uncharacterized protein n=1 Tax=marine sediment metagenome TaxID=412755 RepID=A0A0F9MJN2_9ZZZZ
MITCSECIEQLKPEDPRVRSGRYRLCSCGYCSKPSYFRECENTLSCLENSQYEVKDSPWVSKQWDTIKQIRAMNLFLQRKLNEHIDTSKKKVDKQDYDPF